MVNIWLWIDQYTQPTYPPTCALCGGRGVHGLELCLGCRRGLTWNRLACPRCALPLPRGVTADTPCASCQQRLPPYNHAWAALQYNGGLRWLHRRFKFGSRLAHSRLLSALLANALGQAMADGSVMRPDCILVMPLHPRRLMRRGFNQALELIRPAAKERGIELDWHSLRRTRATRPQTDLPASLRRRNVRGAFTCTRDLRGLHVALFDDVVTTGHTAAEAARVLRRAGASEISVWSLARTS